MKKDYSVSLARFIAMCFVIVCHIMQRDSVATVFSGVRIEWANWFNVGVQMFLFISGYLYGKRKNIQADAFYGKAFIKIISNYYVFVIAASAAFYILPKTSIGISSIVKMLTFSGAPVELGLGHLWYIKTILFCYLLTPLFSCIIDASDGGKLPSFCIKSVIIIGLVQILTMLHFKNFGASYVVCYLVGMICGMAEEKTNKFIPAVNAIALVMCIILLSLQIKYSNTSDAEAPKIIRILYETICDYGHVFLGIVLVAVARLIYKKLFNKSKYLVRILDWSDKYSYDVYLVHTIFILSPYACAEFINNRIISIPLALILIVSTAMILHFASNGIKKLIIK